MLCHPWMLITYQCHPEVFHRQPREQLWMIWIGWKLLNTMTKHKHTPNRVHDSLTVKHAVSFVVNRRHEVALHNAIYSFLIKIITILPPQAHCVINSMAVWFVLGLNHREKISSSGTCVNIWNRVLQRASEEQCWKCSKGHKMHSITNHLVYINQNDSAKTAMTENWCLLF